MLASAAVMVPGMLVLGSWVSNEIEQGINEITASSTAMYMDTFVAPLVQELATRERLSEQAQAGLTALMNNAGIGERIESFKIWKRGGVIAFSTHPATIGKRFAVTSHLKRAWRGEFSAEFGIPEHEKDAIVRRTKHPLLEMYSPIREQDTGRIIAVGEFYETADRMKAALLRARLKSWALVAAMIIAIFLSLAAIVRQGSRTIDSQRGKLEERIAQLSDLRRRVAHASMRTTEINERFLRRLGAELHDGPAQLVSLALLKLGSVKSSGSAARAGDRRAVEEIVPIESALTDALQEIRNLSAGLALPELEGLSFSEVLHKAVDTQERRTRIKVHRKIGELPERVDQHLNICFFRLVQESLNNAFQHAGAETATVTAIYRDNGIHVQITDPGPGFDPESVIATTDGLGLSGLRERIESLGGFFELESAPDAGTRVSARFFMMDIDA